MMRKGKTYQLMALSPSTEQRCHSHEKSPSSDFPSALSHCCWLPYVVDSAQGSDLLLNYSTYSNLQTLLLPHLSWMSQQNYLRMLKPCYVHYCQLMVCAPRSAAVVELWDVVGVVTVVVVVGYAIGIEVANRLPGHWK
jgi:hypothetical protein